MPIRTGQDRIREALAEQAARAASGRKWLFLRDDGEQARIRFLSDIDNAEGPGGIAPTAKFHMDRPKSGQGMSDPIMCTEDETCALCTTAGEPSRLLLLAWVYVYYVDHAENREQGRFGGEPWQAVQGQSGRTLYREKINGPRVLRATSRLISQIMTVYGHEGSLLTKDYTLTRSGKRGDTGVNYHLYPLKEAPFKHELEELVSLVDFAEGRVTLRGEEATGRDATVSREPVSDDDLEEYPAAYTPDEESEAGDEEAAGGEDDAGEEDTGGEEDTDEGEGDADFQFD